MCPTPPGHETRTTSWFRGCWKVRASGFGFGGFGWMIIWGWFSNVVAYIWNILQIYKMFFESNIVEFVHPLNIQYRLCICYACRYCIWDFMDKLKINHRKRENASLFKMNLPFPRVVCVNSWTEPIFQFQQLTCLLDAWGEGFNGVLVASRESPGHSWDSQTKSNKHCKVL